MLNNFPDVVGVKEVVKMCSFNRSRLYQLRSAGRFPEPYLRLANGPLWLRVDVYAFLDTWSSTPGRRKGDNPRSEDVSVPG